MECTEQKSVWMGVVWVDISLLGEGGEKTSIGVGTSYAALISLNFSSAPGALLISGWYCYKT